MKITRRTQQAVTVLAMALALTAVLGACGSDIPTGKTVPTMSAPTSSATTIGMSNCTSCHNSQTESWKKGMHANLDDGDLDGVGNPTLAQLDGQVNSEKCLSCHDALDDGRNQLVAGYTGNTPRPVVSCESCHGGGSDHNGVGPIATTKEASSGSGTTLQSSEFNTCTNVCHPMFGSGEDFDFVKATHIDRTMQYHAAVPGDTRRTMVTDVAPTAVFSVMTPSIVFYVKKFDNKACTVCHSAHRASADLSKEYAESRHGDPSYGPWVHYDWKDVGRFACQRCHTSTGFKNLADSLRSGTTYSALQNDYSYLYQGETSSLLGTLSGQNEALYCWACHTNTRGTIRNPGAFFADYSYESRGTTYSIASHTYPDVLGSNVCIPCHTGRQSGNSIKNMNALGMPVVDFGNQSFVDPHYRAAGAMVFRGAGYEFEGRLYDDPMLYLHNKIGTVGAPGTGSNGPCAGCHMSFAEEKHHYQATKISSTNGSIVEVTSAVCETCHIGGDALLMSPEMLQEQKDMLHESLEALVYYMSKKGINFRAAYPYYYKLRSTGTASLTSGSTYEYVSTGTVKIGDYFKFDIDGIYSKITNTPTATSFTLESVYSGSTTTGAYTVIMSGSPTAVALKNWLSTGDTDSTGDTTGKNNMGTALNFSFLEEDPGAYAHNRYYAKRLIYDSIDWLDDNVMNYSVGDTLMTTCSGSAMPAWCGGAEDYLLNSSGGRP